MISGFGICSQRACAEIRAGPDRNTACQFLNQPSGHCSRICKTCMCRPCLLSTEIIQVCIACQVPKDVYKQRQRKTGGLVNEKYRDHSACLTLFLYLFFGFSGPLVFDWLYHFVGRALGGFRSFTLLCRNSSRKCDLPVLILFERPFSAVQFLPCVQPAIQKWL